MKTTTDILAAFAFIFAVTLHFMTVSGM